jgi:hypothetical protein
MATPYREFFDFNPLERGPTLVLYQPQIGLSSKRALVDFIKERPVLQNLSALGLLFDNR